MLKSFSSKQLTVFFGLLALFATSAFFMANVELPAWSPWLSGLNVILFAIPAYWATRRWLGWNRGIALWLVLGIYALLIESLAIFTGFPYGHFGYSDLLGAKLFGVTPWTVFLAWTPIILGAYAASRRLFTNVIVRISSTAVIATMFDLVLDPGAVKLGFWRYQSADGFYGVPISNFAGWLVTGTVAAIVIELFFLRPKPHLPSPVQLTSSAFLILFFWTFIAIFSGMVIPALIGILLLAGIALYWRVKYYRFDEMLVYCDESGKPIGTELKSSVHTVDTKQHLAFSIFLFDGHGKLLLQQRSLSKKTWPGIWSNSCCGHVMMHEQNVDAAKRRLKFELGLSGIELFEILPDYRYRAEKDGVVENEICPVFVGFTGEPPRPNPDEVAAVRWVDWAEFLQIISEQGTEISPWAVEEARLLDESPEFNYLFEENVRNTGSL